MSQGVLVKRGIQEQTLLFVVMQGTMAIEAARGRKDARDLQGVKDSQATMETQAEKVRLSLILTGLHMQTSELIQDSSLYTKNILNRSCTLMRKGDQPKTDWTHRFLIRSRSLIQATTFHLLTGDSLHE